MSGPDFVLVGAVAAERLVELVVAHVNCAWARARGGVEYGRGHYPWMVALHLALFAGCLVEPPLTGRGFDALRYSAGTAVVAAAQGLRWWTIATLGRRWNTRIIVIPGLPLVTGGPFRFLRHPNYLAVAIELVALPVAVGALATAAAVSALNALLMGVRIPREEAALGLRAGRA